MKNFLLTILILTAVFLCVLSFCAHEVLAAKALDAPVECNGDTVEYFREEKKVVGSGNVVILYKDIKLTCDKVTVWPETKDVEAEGSIKFAQGEGSFKGEKLTYNFSDSTGDITNFKGEFDPWYTKGKTALRLGPDEFQVKTGYVTTCDHVIPHWKLSASKVQIYPGKLVETHNAVIWANPLSMPFSIPVMWVPYYCHPLDDDRPHVTLIPGKSSDWGLYLLTKWRYHLTPNQKGYLRLDYREKKGIAVGMDYIYDTKGFGKGNITTYYMNERDLQRGHIWYKWYKKEEKDNAPTIEEEKGLLRIRHQWDIAPTTQVTAEMYKYKDENFLKDYFYTEYEQDENPESYLLFSHSMKFCNVTLLTKKRMNRFESTTELLPEAKVDFNNQNLFNSNFYYTGNFKAVNMNQVFPRHTDDNPGTITPPNHNNIYDAYNKLSYQTKLSFVNVAPFMGTRQTYFARSLIGDKAQTRGVFYAGFDASTKFFKVFDIQAAPLGLEINRLRHVITPSIGYSYIHPPTLTPGRVFGDGIGRTNTMSFGLENKLQTKRGEDSGIADIAMLYVDTSYSFQHTPGGELNDFSAQLELKPYGWLIATSRAVIDPHMRTDHEWLQRINNDLFFNFQDKGSFGIGQSYSAGANGLILQAKIDAIPGWNFSIYEDISILATRHGTKKKWDLKDQEYVINKDLHCWEAEVRYSVDRDLGEELIFIIRLKAFPDIPFEFGRNYHRPKVGSQESIR